MSENTQLSTDRRGQQLQQYMRSPAIMERFAQLMGNRQAAAYISSVLIAVANGPDALKACSPQSIVTSAMRAATLHLSCDPATKQAHLVPFKGKATLVVGYKGLHDMAVRTNKYRYLNDFPVFEGQTVEQNQLTGEIKLIGLRKTDKIIGYGLFFELTNGFRKAFYMTVEEIDAHARRYSKSYGMKDSPWTTDFDKMARKTVIRLGLGKYGYLDPMDVMTLEQNEEADSVDNSLPDPEKVVDVTEKERAPESQIMSELGFEGEPEEPKGPYTREDAERDAAKAEEAPAPQKAEPPALRYSPEQLKARIAEIAKGTTGQVANGKRGAVVGLLEMILSQNTDPAAARHQLLKFLTGQASTKEIPDNVMLALHKWLNPSQDSGGEWQPDPMAAREALAAFVACQPKQDALL